MVFYSVPHLYMESQTNLPNLAQFVSCDLMASHGHFHSHQFLMANIFFYVRFSKNRLSPWPSGNTEDVANISQGF